MAAPQENLEERIERIRKRNEELEKKHREAEEDRLAALKDNAMVKTKNATSEDWPRGHRYDKDDYPSGSRDSVDGAGEDKESGVTTGPKGRDYKKFADGEGPPPDPSYNFLADAERDGNNEKSPTDKKDWRQLNGGPQQGGQVNSSRSRGGLNNSFKGRNGGGKGQRVNGNQGGMNRQNKSSDSGQEFNQWKNERDRIDEARIGRQKLGDGKWRRDWDNEKNATEDISNAVEKISLNQAPVKQANHNTQEKPKNYSNQINNNSVDFSTKGLPSMEKRGNVMVSVSKDGEVKSVKLQSNRAIGTGRVGPRQVPFQTPPYPSTEPVHTDQFPLVNHFNQPPHIVSNAQYYQQPPQPLPIHHVPQYQTEPVYYDIPAPAPRPFFDGRPNLQDRLARHRQPASNATNSVTTDKVQQKDSAQITVGY